MTNQKKTDIDKKPFSQMSQEELHEVTHKVVMEQFAFPGPWPKPLIGGETRKN